MTVKISGNQIVTSAGPTGENGWTPATEWPGNPALNMRCSFKVMRTEHGARTVPVLVFGGGDPPYEGWGSYCVSAGADSDLSHSGFAPGCTTEREVQDWIDKKFEHLQ